jgi:hypothetical protein
MDDVYVAHLASKLLVITGDRGPSAENTRAAMAHLPEASFVFLPNYSLLGWSDVVADHAEEIGSALFTFWARRKRRPVETSLLRPGDRER